MPGGAGAGAPVAGAQGRGGRGVSRAFVCGWCCSRSAIRACGRAVGPAACQPPAPACAGKVQRKCWTLPLRKRRGAGPLRPPAPALRCTPPSACLPGQKVSRDPPGARCSGHRRVRIVKERQQQAAQQAAENLKSWDPNKDPNVQVGGGRAGASMAWLLLLRMLRCCSRARCAPAGLRSRCACRASGASAQRACALPDVCLPACDVCLGVGPVLCLWETRCPQGCWKEGGI